MPNKYFATLLALYTPSLDPLCNTAIKIYPYTFRNYELKVGASSVSFWIMTLALFGL